VASGKVALRAVTNAAQATARTPARGVAISELRLVAGDVGEVSTDGGLNAHHTADVHQYFAWTEGRLVFRDVPFTQALPQLSRWYDLDFHADSVIAARKLTTVFRDESAADVIRALAFVLNANVEQHGRVISFTSKK
jgi:ferric-dicitrate binding protein FerR (iron transport regulator)